MKLSAQEEYGLRCLLRLAREEGGSLTIPEVSRSEGISPSYVAKLMRILRRGGVVRSVRGKAGGYALARPPERIVIGEVVALLGGRLYEPEFCEQHAGVEDICTNSTDCSIRSLWRGVQVVVDQILSRTTLRDLLGRERTMASGVDDLVRLSGVRQPTAH